MKVGIITGANGGIGQQITQALAREKFRLIMACKNKQSGELICRQIQRETACSSIEVMELDLASFDSVKRFVKEFQSGYSRLDILINNAGVLCHRPTKTKENVEYTIGVNYLGHYVLTEQLFPFMSEGTRIINTVSLMLRYGKIQSDFFAFPQRDFNKFACYSHSKLALYYAALDWAEKWKDAGCMVNCVDPGIVNTNIIRMGNKLIDTCCDLFFRPFIRTPQQGADSIIYLATNNDPEFVTGQLFKNRKIKQISPLLQDSAQRASLALQTQQFLNKYI